MIFYYYYSKKLDMFFRSRYNGQNWVFCETPKGRIYASRYHEAKFKDTLV